jgi:hypothetical protein
MANALYPIGKKGLLDADIDMLVDDIKVVAVSSTYTYSTAHDFRNDLTGVIATSANLGSKTTTGGVFDAADLAPAFTSVATNINAYVIFKDTGDTATSPLIAYIDTGSGLPLTQDGGNVNITWNASGIFAI